MWEYLGHIFGELDVLSVRERKGDFLSHIFGDLDVDHVSLYEGERRCLGLWQLGCRSHFFL